MYHGPRMVDVMYDKYHPDPFRFRLLPAVASGQFGWEDSPRGRYRSQSALFGSTGCLARSERLAVGWWRAVLTASLESTSGPMNRERSPWPRLAGSIEGWDALFGRSQLSGLPAFATSAQHRGRFTLA